MSRLAEALREPARAVQRRPLVERTDRTRHAAVLRCLQEEVELIERRRKER